MSTSTTVQAGAASQAAKPTRRRELDVIGMGIVLALVFLHTISIFSGQQLVVSDPAKQSRLTTILCSLVISFITTWAMPVLMFIAGMTIRYSLRRRTVGQFVRDRIGRLFVPFLTGLALVIPPMVYYHLKFRFPQYQQTLLQFYPRFWNVRFSLAAFPLFVKGTPQVWAGTQAVQIFDISHLWFLLYLFVYTLLLLPLFRYLLQPSGQRLVERLATFFSRRWNLYLLALPVAVIEGVLATEWPGAWNRFVWPFLILYGFVFSGDERFDLALVRDRKSALTLGINCFALYFASLGVLMAVQGNPFTSPSPIGVLGRFLKGLASWFLVIAVMGIATHRGQRWVETAGQPTLTDRFAAYAQEAQLPFYVLHQLPIILIGYYVVQWDANALIKLAVICLASYLVTFVLYDIAVKRTAITRFLFGMKSKS